MNNLAPLLGAGICCIVPLICFAAGIYVERFGLPVSVRWRGIARRDEEEE